MNYWQVAAGDGRRDYSEVFLKYGVMLIGPGDPGSYFENEEHYKNSYKPKDITVFAEQVKDGDIVVLKRPSGKLWEVIAVGIVKEEYNYLPVFDDVESWDLQHCRYVEWRKPQKPVQTTGLTRGTFKGINKQSTIQTISDLLQPGPPISSEPIPKPSEKLTDEDLIEILINHGLRPKDAEDFTQTIHRIRRLVKWYYENGANVSEHETRTFLIIPLLLTLGWTEQKLKIEWNNIDIAFFEKPYTKQNKDSNECIIIFESKRLWEGLSYVTSQAATYATKYPKCGRMIVSDGCCYKLFVCV
ncbi:MAG: hypothetical protein WBD09_01050 [Halobacteriota archaeon]